MDFNLSEEHQMLSDSLRRYLAKQADMEARNRVAYTAPYHDPALWRGLAELGVIGAFVDEAAGGFGGSAQDVSVVFEEIGRALCVEPLLGTLMGLRLLSGLGRGDVIEAVIAGEARLAVAVHEPEVVCDLAHITASARETADGWLLSGRKSAIQGGPGADHLLVAARTARGLGLFLATKPPLIEAAMIDGGGIADLEMADLPADCLSPDCAELLDEALDLGRIALCAEAVGAMDHLITLTIDYLTQRKQFGRAIGDFQALRHRVVDMVAELEQCRSITISAVAAFGSPDRARRVSMAKNLIGRMGTMVAEEAIQLHGGIGMTWEYPGAHYAKRLIMLDHQLGDRHDHAQRMLRLAQSRPAHAEAA